MAVFYDVIVAGGGPAGVAAAIAAARSGAKTLLIEASGSLGGTVTNGSLPAFCPFGNTDEPLIRGIGLELLETLRAETKLPPYYHDRPEKPLYNWFPVDGEALKRILDEKVLSSGCELLLHTHIAGCETEEGVVRSVTVHTPGGMESFFAKVFVDCTGDGVLSAEAGCEIQLGNEENLVQSGTLCFKIAPFDTERFIRYAEETGEGGNLLHACTRAMADGAFPEGETKVAGIAFPYPGAAVLNFGHVYGIDPLNAASLTRAEVEARKKLPELLRFLQNYVPGAEKAVIVSSGPNLGIRESCRVMGDYVLTKEDFFRRADFDDAIAYYCYPIDIHALRPGEQTKEWNELYYNRRYQPGEAYGVPYRCLTPKGIKNLLTAGKIISCDQIMLGSVRVVPCCFATGQAAGTAAAVAARRDGSVRSVDPAALRDSLKRQGCFLR